MTAMPDLPLPPALALDDEPLSEETLGHLDAAFAIAVAEGVASADLVDWADTTPMPGGPDPIPEEVRRWEITDDGAAQWAMAHCATIDTELAALSDQRDDWQARIDHWYRQRADVVVRRRTFFQAHLVAYAAARRAADPKAPKTLSLPSGRVVSSDQKAKVKVTDDAALAVWLAEHGLMAGPDGADLVLTTTKVYAVPLRKVLQPAGDGLVIVATGEVIALPAGLDVEPEHTTYDIKPVLG